MALTMTRTRTQTALTKLVEMLANINGELAFVDGLLGRGDASAGGSVVEGALNPEIRVLLAARRLKLAGDRAALCTTIRRFDAEIDPERVGALEGWRLRFGRRPRTGESLFVTKYIDSLGFDQGFSGRACQT